MECARTRGSGAFALRQIKMPITLQANARLRPTRQDEAKSRDGAKDEGPDCVAQRILPGTIGRKSLRVDGPTIDAQRVGGSHHRCPTCCQIARIADLASSRGGPHFPSCPSAALQGDAPSRPPQSTPRQLRGQMRRDPEPASASARNAPICGCQSAIVRRSCPASRSVPACRPSCKSFAAKASTLRSYCFNLSRNLRSDLGHADEIVHNGDHSCPDGDRRPHG